jgi:hypothetical protein
MARLISILLTWLLVGFFGWSYYDSNFSEDGRKCKFVGGTWDRLGEGCTKRVTINYKLKYEEKMFGCKVEDTTPSGECK